MQKLIKKISISILTLFLPLTLIACGGGKDPSEDIPTSPSIEETEKVTVTFVNTDLQPKTMNKGDSLARPNDPSKQNYIFGGWYHESSFLNEVKFPLIVNEDTSIYAKFNSFETAFAFIEARDKTVGDGVDGFSYDYQTRATASYSSFSFEGLSDGTSSYAKDKKVSFYETHVNSGVLFVDGTKHQFKEDALLTHINFNDKNELTKYETEYVDPSYKYDYSSFAKALFTLDDEKIKSVESVGSNRYKINTSILYSDVLSTILNYLNHPIVEKLIIALPETSASTNMYVTFENGYIKTYRYEFVINAASINFVLSYDLQFTKYGTNEIVLPSFNGLSIDQNSLNNKTETLNEISDNYKSQINSSYNFEVKTGINFDGTNSIDSTFKGNTLRKVNDGTVFFHNDIEIDSDLKNGDLYKDENLEDIHIIKTKLADESVHIIEKKVLKDKTYESTEESTDAYYMFDIVDYISEASCIQTKEKDEFITLNKDAVLKVINYFNNTLDLDPTNITSGSIKTLGEIDFNTLVVNECLFNIEYENNQISSIDFELDAEGNVSYPGSRDFSSKALASISIDFSIEITDEGIGFEPFNDVDDAK